MLKTKIKNLLSFLKNKRILITTHDLVDIDGFVSCFALKFFLTQYNKNINTSVYLPELLKSTKNFKKKFCEKFPKFTFKNEVPLSFSNFDICLILDTNNVNHVKFKNDLNSIPLEIPYIFIDHHYPNLKLDTQNLESFNLIFDNFTSTVEIILTLFKSYQQDLTLPYKFLIIAAILTDSGFFKYGANETINNVSELLDEDIDIREIQILLKEDIDISEKIAKIKGLQRVKLIRESNYLIGISNVSSFGASVASMLITCGVDISLVYSKNNTGFRINARAKKVVCLQTGIHLGQILREISDNCEGGGHDGAAHISCNAEFDIILEKIIKKIREFLSPKF
ncbi:MAG: bifunctional oligoribonuclease/PAP phosphatase NrnA [Promethearchaeota archaeon]